MSVLAVAGDVGGARVIIPVLACLSDKGQSFAIVDHGSLTCEAPALWKRIPKDGNSLQGLFKSGYFKVLIFGTSVKDTTALKIARLARSFKVFVICLLDNWMNYRRRLEVDNEPMFLPDIYMVMDEPAFQQALDEGIPASVLRVVGQPALASLEAEFHQWTVHNKNQMFERFGLNKGKKLIVFISEPAEADNGSGPEFPQYRGYTEKTVLKELCNRLQSFSDKYQMAIIPHPRQDVNDLNNLWRQCCGNVEGGLLRINGRHSNFLADGVAGMTSILLYEAWLINKPVISLQPGLCKPHLDIFQKRKGIFCITDNSQWQPAMKAWSDEIDSVREPAALKQDIKVHSQAPENVARIIIGCLNNYKEQLQ